MQVHPAAVWERSNPQEFVIFGVSNQHVALQNTDKVSPLVIPLTRVHDFVPLWKCNEPLALQHKGKFPPWVGVRSKTPTSL